ncbi:hypothetical protein CPB85DRAFT_1291594 [Mucidula mucida]|nr:hypothetical protein CPB85DRAFT_1291594 [Mucidula mucida]
MPLFQRWVEHSASMIPVPTCGLHNSLLSAGDAIRLSIIKDCFSSQISRLEHQTI